MSRNVENLSLAFPHLHQSLIDYSIPDFFYTNSSVKQLHLDGCTHLTTSSCSVSWASLKKLSLDSCDISEESLAKILCGCPVLESLRLFGFTLLTQLKVVDLSKSPRLLEIHLSGVQNPYIHYLRLTSNQYPVTLVDVSSLTKVKLDFFFCPIKDRLDADLLQVMALEMLKKLKTVKKLTFGENFLKILSLVELRGVPFPILKAQVLTLKTNFSQYVMHGIVRVLQNSPQLKKLTLKRKSNYGIIPDKHLDYYLYSHSLNLNRYRILRESWPLRSKHVSFFMKYLLKNTKRLEKMVVIGLKDDLQGRGFEKLLQMVPVLSHDNNVAIVFT
ncbi:PREDICTED: F-box/LRR-repeat protein At3g03360-like [Camelina sativa]|uniref:F-box/LRR-repeat protein At3g03360-like n=1 Tax=Camelina sativa TaxID=90675 RepID=A0ABM0ZAQ1_CAMSA|nr:PREDICTED: F-box/LRR-repeat protein At3g03360-like [Camelina sativa]